MSRPRRRGMSLVMVLLLVSVTMAVSYAVLRTQGTVRLVGYNADLEAAAHQAAQSGLAVALQKMHGDPAGWVGADGTFSQTLGANQGFTIQYATGDAALGATHAEYPYRVTVTSTGYAQDPTDPNRRAYHYSRAVLRLVPRYVVKPSGWNNPVVTTTYALYPGGKKTYAVQSVDNFDPQTNPLRLLRVTSTAGMVGNTTFEGTLIVDGSSSDFWVWNTGNQLLPPDLPPFSTTLQNGEIRVRLPSLVVGHEVYIMPNSELTVRGMILVEDDFYLSRSGGRLTIRGGVASWTVDLDCAGDWHDSSATWTNDYNENQANPGVTYWPRWVPNASCTLPVTIQSESPASSARYHWYIVNENAPLFTPHPDNDRLPAPYNSQPAGLRWDVVRWQDTL